MASSREVQQPTGQGPESADFSHIWAMFGSHISRLSDSEPVNFVASGAGSNVTATLTLSGL